MSKPTREMLERLEQLTTAAAMGRAPLINRNDSELLERLLDDYRARGVALRMLRTIAQPQSAADLAASALGGAGDEP